MGGTQRWGDHKGRGEHKDGGTTKMGETQRWGDYKDGGSPKMEGPQTNGVIPNSIG